jgi:hypothetical protein
MLTICSRQEIGELMEATAEFEEDHCTTTPDIGDPLPSNTAAMSLQSILVVGAHLRQS